MESAEQSNILGVHSVISQFQEEGKYYDITVRVGAETFKCHQLFLCAWSEYFDKMFEGHFMESNVGKDNPIELHGMDSATFKEILNFMYNGKVRITDSNYYKLLRASDFLQLRVPYIEKQCIDHLQNTEIPKIEPIPGAIEMFHFAHASSREMLLSILAKHIFRHLNYFSREPEFLNLSFDDFKLILNCKNSFSCINEDLLMETITQWLDNHSDCEERKKWSQELMTNVDESRLSQQCKFFLMKSYVNSVHHSPEKTIELYDELIKLVDTSKLSAQMLTSFVNQYVNHKSENGLVESGQNGNRSTYYDAYPLDYSSPIAMDDMTLHLLTYYKEKHGSSIFSLTKTSMSDCEWLHSWGHEFSTEFTCDSAYLPSHLRVIKVGNAFYQLSYNYEYDKYINFGIQDSIHEPITKILKHPPALIFTYGRLEICGDNHGENNINLYNHDAQLLQHNCKLDQWFSIQVPLPQTSSSRAVCSMIENLVYLTARVVNRGHLNFNIAYDSRMKEWLHLPTEFHPWSWHSSEKVMSTIGDICVHQGKLYAVYNIKGKNDSYIIGYDSRAQKWVEISNLHGIAGKIGEPRLVSYRNELWMFSTDKRFNIEKYNFTSGKSQHEPSLNVAVQKAHLNSTSAFLDAIVC